jgi:hypothetical protein
MTTRPWPTDGEADFVIRSPVLLANVQHYAQRGHFGYALRLNSHVVALAAMVEVKDVLDRYWKGRKP